MSPADSAASFDLSRISLPEGYALRLMSPGDMPAIAGLMVEYFSELGLDLEQDGLDHDLADPEYGYQEGGFLLLCHGGEPVGCVGLRAWGEDAGEVKRMFIQKEHRGRGLGGKLLTTVVEMACEKGFSRLLLDTKKNLKAANHLYQKQGFKDTMNYNLNPRASRFMCLEID